VLVEPRKASVASHYRPDRLKVMLGKMIYELSRRSTGQNADDLEIADRAADFVLSSPQRRNNCCASGPADQDHSPSERKPCPTSHSSTTTSIPTPRACGSR
jgi:hypothetical protein